MNHDEALTRTAMVIRETLMCGPVPIARTTRALDVRGWDSLSHTSIVLNLEDAFHVQLPLDRIVTAQNVGDLVDLIVEIGGS